MINPLFAAATLIGLALPMLPTKSERAERRLYWSGACIAAVSAFFVLYPPDWRGGLGLAGALAGGLVVRAYMTRSYIRIRGKTYAFNLSDSKADDADPQPPLSRDTAHDPAPDSYAGIATAPKMWWLFVIVIGACTWIVAIFIMSREGPWYAAGAGATMAIVPLLLGHQDASWGYRVARGQLVQFTIAGIATLGTFTVLYCCAYAAGKRWPLRPKGSMEYRAHPHLRKKFP